MLRQQKVIIVECDLQSGDECWEEMTVSLESDETIEDAIQFFQEMGWGVEFNSHEENEDNISKCPWCNIGKLKEDEGLYLLENEEWEG